MSLPPSPAPIATGWSDSCRAGFAPARRRRLSTAHRPRKLRQELGRQGGPHRVAPHRGWWRCWRSTEGPPDLRLGQSADPSSDSDRFSTGADRNSWTSRTATAHRRRTAIPLSAETAAWMTAKFRSSGLPRSRITASPRQVGVGLFTRARLHIVPKPCGPGTARSAHWPAFAPANGGDHVRDRKQHAASGGAAGPSMAPMRKPTCTPAPSAIAASRPCGSIPI